VKLFGDPEGAAERARQLGDLLDAVHRAQQVARALGQSREDDNEVKLLFGRLEAVRLELEQLQRSEAAPPFEEIDPKWTGFVPWRLVSEY
jgi:hypothetical protein